MHLRSYERIARIFHFCDNCHNYIVPGSHYRGDVILNSGQKANRVYVLKEHIEPECPPDPGKEHYDSLDDTLNLELIVNSSVESAEISKAA